LFQTQCLSKLLVALLIALVVQCPLQCIVAGCLADEIGNGYTTCSCCCDGPHPVDDSEKPRPDVPADCACGDCICDGALPVNDRAVDVVGAELVSFMAYCVKRELTLVALPTSQVNRSSIVLPVDASALEVRAALCCWVI
jgi:hypothetical protein